VPRLEAEREYVERDIRPGFVDDTDDAQRYRDLFQFESAVYLLFLENDPEWGREACNVSYIRCDIANALRRKFQPIVLRVGFRHPRKVFAVRLENCRDIILRFPG